MTETFRHVICSGEFIVVFIKVTEPQNMFGTFQNKSRHVLNHRGGSECELMRT